MHEDLKNDEEKKNILRRCPRIKKIWGLSYYLHKQQLPPCQMNQIEYFRLKNQH